jgi:hypothetical protein
MRVSLLGLLLCGCGASSLISSSGEGAGQAVGATLSLSPDSVVVPVGEPAQIVISVVDPSGQSWRLSVAGLPPGVTGTFDVPAASAATHAVLTLSADGSAPAANVTITITGASATGTISASAAVEVQPDSSSVGGGTATGGGAGGNTGSGGGTALGGGAGGGSTSSGGGTGGGSATKSCPGFAAPDEVASCTCTSGHTCTANNCYGGWYCNETTNRCVAQPASCGGSTGGGGGSTGGGGGSTGGGGGHTGGGGGGGSTGTVGPTGGTVGLLHFGITGDTRPPNCEDTPHYPTAIITSIADAMKTKGAQFAVDEGDHMYVCNNSLSIATEQMALFTQATSSFGGTWFMTMGNHECSNGPCLSGSTNANYVAFMNALSPISTKPYYSFQVQTQLGRATFIVLADNAWDSTQQTWFEQTLTDADTHSKYTIVFRHHPEGDTSVSTNPVAVQILRQHKFALFVTGHTHTYKHGTTDNGRDVVIGLGGAPLLSAGATYNGYAMIDQGLDGRLTVTVYDIAGGTVRDTWSVGPN